ncbi:MAG: putative immunity protein [Lewinella sp.]|uniref:putative immunity protein n=1 Tax=Lewinella sp. TaxID=2004506 RepID=UPI003D6AC1EC
MKKVFSKKYIMDNRGCYSKTDVEKIPCINEKITLKKLYAQLPYNDFVWFFSKQCGLTSKQLSCFALGCANLAMQIFEKDSQNDNSVRDCIEKTELYLKGQCSLEALEVAVAAAASTATDDDYAYDVVYAAVAAAAATDDDYAYVYVDEAYGYAYDYAYSAKELPLFKKKVWELIEGFK